MSTQDIQKPPRIVVGVDGSDESKQALRWAESFATATGASIDAIAVWQMPSADGWAPIPGDWDPEKDAEIWLGRAVDDVFKGGRPSRMTLLVQQGSPAPILLSESEGATMLILGSRGHGGFAGLLLGSVSAKCAEHAQCPVLVVHGDRLPPSFTTSGQAAVPAPATSAAG